MRRWLQLRFDFDSNAIRPSFDSHSTAIRPRCDLSTTYVTIVGLPVYRLLHWGLNKQAVGRRAAAKICPAPLLPTWASKRLAPPSRPRLQSADRNVTVGFPTVNTFPRSPLQLPDALTLRWVKRPGDLWPLSFWSWKWCPSYVWRRLLGAGHNK